VPCHGWALDRSNLRISRYLLVRVAVSAAHPAHLISHARSENCFTP
jgi:hypothetical protein